MGTDPTPSRAGRVIHWALRYDLFVWVASLGKERAFREEQVDLARLATGEFVLDIGCAHHAGRDHFDLRTMVPLLSECGLNEVESGTVRFSLMQLERLQYVLAAARTDVLPRSS